MKERICTAVSTVLLAAPWSIFILRQKTWALESPGAEIVIGCYAALMVLGCLFTFLAYAAGKVQNSWMKLCLVIHIAVSYTHLDVYKRQDLRRGDFILTEKYFLRTGWKY